MTVSPMVFRSKEAPVYMNMKTSLVKPQPKRQIWILVRSQLRKKRTSRHHAAHSTDVKTSPGFTTLDSPSSERSSTAELSEEESSSPQTSQFSTRAEPEADPAFQNITSQDTLTSTSLENSTSTPGLASHGPARAAALRRGLEQWGLMPLAVVGVVMNVLVLWVWQGEGVYQPTTFLFKYLAVWDGLCLLTFAVYISKLDTVLSKVMLPMSNVSQRVSVHTTLLVSILRWLAVRRPLHVRSWLSATRVRLTCAGLLLWCTATEAFFLYAVYADIDRQTAWTMCYLQRVVGLAVPLVLMLVFNVLLIITTRRSRQNLGLSNHTESRNSITLTIVSISLCSLITYPIAVITETATSIHCYQGNVYRCNSFFVYCIKYVAFTLQIINLGINFVLYLTFISRFRRLLILRLPCCGRCCPTAVTAVNTPASGQRAYSIDYSTKNSEYRFEVPDLSHTQFKLRSGRA